MKKTLCILVSLSFLAVGIGCATKQLWMSSPNMEHAANEYFDATISPIYTFDGYKGFNLYIHNKTTGNLEVDWNNTFYLYKGEKQGGFWFKGIPYADRNKPRPPGIVKGAPFAQEIYPSSLLYLSTYYAKAWIHESMKAGENGIYLTVKVDGKEVAETLSLVFSIQQSQ